MNSETVRPSEIAHTCRYVVVSMTVSVIVCEYHTSRSHSQTTQYQVTIHLKMGDVFLNLILIVTSYTQLQVVKYAGIE